MHRPEINRAYVSLVAIGLMAYRTIRIEWMSLLLKPIRQKEWSLS